VWWGLWNSQAVLIPVGSEHLVVFGGLDAPDPSAYLNAAAELVAELQQVSPAKLSADGLVLLTEADDMGAQRYLRRVRHAMRRGGTIGRRSSLRMSLGAAMARIDEALADTVTRADRAMYASKKRRVGGRAT
jgi:hypothetical protein